MSLAAYVLQEIEEIAATPTLQEMQSRIPRLPSDVSVADETRLMRGE